MKIQSLAAVALIVLIAACSDASVQVDEEAYFKMHGRFYDQQDYTPKLSGSTDFIERRNDIAIEIYAGRDTKSIDVLSEDILRWFKAVEERNFPLNIQMTSVFSPLNRRTYFVVWFIDGSMHFSDADMLKKYTSDLYERARDGLHPMYHEGAASGKYWTKVWPVPE